jgi:hypothetical protein
MADWSEEAPYHSFTFTRDTNNRDREKSSDLTKESSLSLHAFHTLQGKSHLCIPFLGIARPQSQFPHHVSVSDLLVYISRIRPHVFLLQNRQTDPGNI